MTDSLATQTEKSNLPTHIAYNVQDRPGGKAFWTRVGSAWRHADGKGFNIQLSATPTNGRITLRVPTEKSK